MNTLIVYYSKFGNTHKTADAIASSIADYGSVNTIEFGQISDTNLDKLDLLVMGSPTHNMNLPTALIPIIDRFPKGILAGTPVAAFDTSYKMSRLLNLFTASKRLARRLRKMGGKLVVPPEIFLVAGREGPLIEGEIERAQEWATTVHEKINNHAAHH